MDLKKMRKDAEASNRLPRATCPVCKRDVAVRNAGELREHRSTPAETSGVCIASGLTLERAAGLANRSIVDRLKRIAEDTAQVNDQTIQEATADLVEGLQEPPAMLETSYSVLPLGSIEPDPANRDLGDLVDLVESIRARGVLEPILVEADFSASSPSDNGAGVRYRLIAGERRLRASQEAGLLGIPALIRPPGEGHDGEVARRIDQTVENLQRKDLTPLEEARQFARLRELGLSQEQIATQVGVAQGTVSKRLALLKLPAPIQEAIASGKVSLETAQKLGRIGAKPVVEAWERAERMPSAMFGRTFDESLARIADEAIETREQEERRKTALKALEERSREAGYPIVDAPLQALHVKGPRALGHAYGHLPIKAKDHEAEPCHALYLSAGHEIKGACKDPKRHNKKGASKLKATVKGARGSGPQGPTRETAETKAARLRREAHIEALEVARGHRRTFLAKLLARKVPPADPIELRVKRYLVPSYDVDQDPDPEDVAEMLGLKVDRRKQHAAKRALAEGDLSTKLALAIELAAYEEAIEPPEAFNYRGELAAWDYADGYFAWLETKGYELSAVERAQIAGEMLEVQETELAPA